VTIRDSLVRIAELLRLAPEPAWKLRDVMRVIASNLFDFKSLDARGAGQQGQRRKACHINLRQHLSDEPQGASPDLEPASSAADEKGESPRTPDPELVRDG
jgi:hypothetical protein